MGTHRGHTTLDPETTITVDDAEHTDLVRWGVWVDAETKATKAKDKTSTEAKDESAGEALTPDVSTGSVVAEAGAEQGSEAAS